MPVESSSFSQAFTICQVVTSKLAEWNAAESVRDAKISRAPGNGFWSLTVSTTRSRLKWIISSRSDKLSREEIGSLLDRGKLLHEQSATTGEPSATPGGLLGTDVAIVTYPYGEVPALSPLD